MKSENPFQPFKFIKIKKTLVCIHMSEDMLSHKKYVGEDLYVYS